ncbi:MAG: hypothetical protein LBD31_01580 [Treponema sp.]|jgi:hypothetical protein|nr:hypothetical protein [Treponema sp.]
MAQKTDLYSLLQYYSRKIESPSIKVEEFTGFLERRARQASGEKPEWERWTGDTAAAVRQELAGLEEDGMVLVTDREREPKIFLYGYYASLVQDAYNGVDYDVSLPFPGGKTFGTKIPSTQIIPLGTGEIPNFLRREGEDSRPVVKLLFPASGGEAVLPASWIPSKLLEVCMFKVRNYMLRQGNKDYLQHKLIPQFPGKEGFLRDFINQLMMRPADCIGDMIAGREIAFYFWAFFCSMIRIELDKADLVPEEQGILQAVYVIEVLNSFFKTNATRARDVDLAFKSLESELDKPPYYFHRDAIEQFTNSRGVPLLGQYSREELDAYIKQHTTEAAPEELPDLLYIHAGRDKIYLVKKTRLLPLFACFLGEARPVILQALHKRWKALLEEWQQEAAMVDGDHFETLLEIYIKDYSPVFASLIKDRRLYLVYEEAKQKDQLMLEASQFFEGGRLLPLRTLLFIRQRDIISEIRILLPIWYSLPLISSCIAFFKNLGKNGPPLSRTQKGPAHGGGQETKDIKSRLHKTALQTAAALIPAGASVDAYLQKLIARWSRLLNQQALNTLVEDMNALIRDKLRHMLHFQKISTVKGDTLDMIAGSIIQTSVELHKIAEQDALTLYIKLYLVKLLTEKTAF